MRKLIGFISQIISLLVPKGKKILFFSYPNFTDNAYAMFRYLYNNKTYDCYKKIWIIDADSFSFEIERTRIEKEYPGVIVRNRKSIMAIYDYYSCEKFFFTHSLYSSLLTINKEKRINLWHGMPLKNIGNLQTNAPKTTVSSDFIISTSPLFQKLMAKAFDHPLEKVLITGMPRNDLFWDDTDFFSKENIIPQNYNKIGMWLPTYKRSIGDDGSIVVDGIESNGISFLGDKELEIFNEHLKKTNILIIVKLHPMDILNKKEYPLLSNIKIFRNSEFTYQLYPVLGKMDFLITDYSSVWVDFEILNKPILFVFNDIEKYQNDRGLTIDNLIEKLPGSVITNLKDLITSIGNIKKYNEQTNLWNTYKDNKSCYRIASSIFK